MEGRSQVMGPLARESVRDGRPTRTVMTTASDETDRTPHPRLRPVSTVDARRRYGAGNVNETSAVWPDATVTFWVWVPSCSCQASMT